MQLTRELGMQNPGLETDALQIVHHIPYFFTFPYILHYIAWVYFGVIET